MQSDSPHKHQHQCHSVTVSDLGTVSATISLVLTLSDAITITVQTEPQPGAPHPRKALPHTFIAGRNGEKWENWMKMGKMGNLEVCLLDVIGVCRPWPQYCSIALHWSPIFRGSRKLSELFPSNSFLSPLPHNAEIRVSRKNVISIQFWHFKTVTWGSIFLRRRLLCHETKFPVAKISTNWPKQRKMQKYESQYVLS